MKKPDYRFSIIPVGKIRYLQATVIIEKQNPKDLTFKEIARYSSSWEPGSWSLKLVSGKIPVSVYKNLVLFVKIWGAGFQGKKYFWENTFRN